MLSSHTVSSSPGAVPYNLLKGHKTVLVWSILEAKFSQQTNLLYCIVILFVRFYTVPVGAALKKSEQRELLNYMYSKNTVNSLFNSLKAGPGKRGAMRPEAETRQCVAT